MIITLDTYIRYLYSIFVLDDHFRLVLIIENNLMFQIQYRKMLVN